MKKNYFSACVVLFISVATTFAQVNFNNGGGTHQWSNTSNWSGGALPSATDIVEVNGAVAYIDTNTSQTIHLLQNSTDRTTNHYFGSPPNASDPNTSSTGTITININDPNDPGSGVINNPTNYAIHQQSTSKTNFVFDGNITINNSAGKGRSILRVSGNSDNQLIFRRLSVLNLVGGSNTIAYAANSTAKIKFNGTITGNKNLLIGQGTTSFGSTADNSAHSGNIQFLAGANVTVTEETVDYQPVFINGSTLSIGDSNTNVSLTLNALNTVQGGATLKILNNNTLNLYVNKSQNGFGVLDFNKSSSNGTLNLDMASGTAIQFADSSLEDWGSGTVNITSFVSGSKVKFGANGNGISAAQLAKITTTPGPGPNEVLSIDSNGWLKFESTLGVENHNAFEFTVYPNPAKDVLKINTQQQLQKVEIADLLGRTVLTQQNVSKSVDVSLLSKGVYIIKLTSEKGISTKKIIKE